ncbi:MAG TPA: hypothetical protein VMR50_19375 [Myxococcota bacterium]|nr:hypothetical protein [Myxococcota bacterium]
MRRAALAVSWALLAFAPTARADFEVTSKVSCVDSSDDKLAKGKAGNEALIALCLGVDANDPSVSDYLLVFGTDPRELRVLRRCDSLLVCVLSSEAGCSVAGPMTDQGFKRKGECVHQLLPAGTHLVSGSLFCSESDKYVVAPSRYTYKGVCSGQLAIDGRPCQISLRTGDEFEAGGACPAGP